MKQQFDTTCYNVMVHTNHFLPTSKILFFLLKVTEVRIKYFDTLPVASALCVLKTGFLFVASEFGNQ